MKVCPPLINKQKQVVYAEVSVLQSKQLQVGDTAGYNRTFKAKRPTTILALGIGYADGLLRSLSNKGCALFYHKNQWLKAPIVGRVAMDITLAIIA